MTVGKKVAPQCGNFSVVLEVREKERGEGGGEEKRRKKEKRKEEDHEVMGRAPASF